MPNGTRQLLTLSEASPGILTLEILIRILGSEYLEDLQKNFVDFIQANKIDVLSFAETQPATGIVRDTLIVSSDSAGKF